jgi:hypothetical protein
MKLATSLGGSIRKLSAIIQYLVIVIFLVSFSFKSGYSQNNCRSANGGGNWQVAGSWTNCGGKRPSATDNVIITEGNPINLQNAETITNFTIETGGRLSSNTGNPALSVTGNFHVDGTMSGVAAVTLNGVNRTMSGSGTIAQSAAITIINNKVIASGSNLFIEGNVTLSNNTTITNQGEISISGTITGSSNTSIWTNDVNSTLNAGSTIFATANSGILNASAVGNTVNFFRGAITIPQPSIFNGYPTYHHMVISGSGSKTLPNATIAVNGNLTLISTLNGNGASKILRLRGNWINNSSSGFTEGFGTVIFDGSVDQEIIKNSIENYNNFILDKPQGNLLLRTNVVIASSSNTSSTLTMTSGNIFCGSHTLTLGKIGTGTFAGIIYTGILNRTSGTIVGKFERFIESTSSPANPVLFPVGTQASYRPANITFNNVAASGSVIVEFNPSFPGSAGLQPTGLQDLPDNVTIYNTMRNGYWTVLPNNSFDTSDFDVSFTGTDFIEEPTNATRLVYRPNPAQDWEFRGTHLPYLNNFTVSRADLNNAFGDFAFGDDTNCINPGAPVLSGVPDVCTGAPPSIYAVVNPVAQSIYQWNITGSDGFVINGTTDQANVDWSDTPVEGTIEVFETNTGGCSGPSTVYPVNVLALVPGTISGISDVPQNADELKPFQTYSTPVKSYYSSFEWTVTGGEIAQIIGNDTTYHTTLVTANSIVVKWGSAGQGSVCVKGNTVCGPSQPQCLFVSIYSLIFTVGTGNGDWGATTPAHRALWNCNCIPTPNDNILITSGRTVRIAVNGGVTAKNLIVAGTLNTGAGIGYTLTVNGNLTFINGTIGQSGTNLAPINLGGGSGTPIIDGIGNITNQAPLNIKANRTISSTAIITKAIGNVVIDPGITLFNSGFVNLGGDVVGLDSESTLINGSGSTLNFGGVALLTQGNLIASFTDNTIHYNSSVNVQAIKSGSYYNLELSGSTEKTAPPSFSVGGNFINNGTAVTANGIGFNPANGTVIFNGTVGSSFVSGSAPVTTFYNLTSNNVSGVFAEMNIDLLGILNVGAGAFFDADGTLDNTILALRSRGDDPATDASIGILPGSNSVRGSVTIERYMSGEGRIYRYIASPVTNARVIDWQDDFPITGNFTGRSTSPSPICGLNLTLNPSMYWFDESRSGNESQRYIPYPEPTSDNLRPLIPGRGYASFVRWCDTPTLIDVRGPVHQGEFNFSSLLSFTNQGQELDGYNLIGNPYASAISWDSPNWTKLGISNVIAIRDNGSGIMRYYDGVAGDSDDFNGIIASGQAFWIRTTSGSFDLRIREGAKAPGSNHAFYRERPSDAISSMIISLARDTVTDKAIIRIREGVQEGLDNWDAPKLQNEALNLSSVTVDGLSMAINAFPSIHHEQTIPLKIADAEPGSYLLNLDGTEEFLRFEVELTDHYTEKVERLNWGDSYSFVISDVDKSSASPDRISLRLIKIGTAERKEKSYSLNVYPNPVEGVLNVNLRRDNFPKMITVFNTMGNRLEDIRVEPNAEKAIIDFSSKTSGVYLIRLSGSGYSSWAKVIKN